MSAAWAAVAAGAILAVPFVPQERDTCGAAALAMVLAYWDRPVSHDAIAAALRQPELRGIAGSRLEAFARQNGMRAVAHRGDPAALREHLARGRPMIVAWRLGRRGYHDVVVVGHDAVRGEYIVHDPAQGSARRIRATRFERRWSDAGNWALLVVPSPP